VSELMAWVRTKDPGYRQQMPVLPALVLYIRGVADLEQVDYPVLERLKEEIDTLIDYKKAFLGQVEEEEQRLTREDVKHNFASLRKRVKLVAAHLLRQKPFITVEDIIKAYRRKYGRWYRDDTITRRIRELTDPGIEDPPLLRRVGYGKYTLNPRRRKP